MKFLKCLAMFNAAPQIWSWDYATWHYSNHINCIYCISKHLTGVYVNQYSIIMHRAMLFTSKSLHNEFTNPLALPTTSFLRIHSCPGAYNPLSSTELLSPLVKSFTSPFSLQKKNYFKSQSCDA